jgi:serine/threonine-protein kinase RsbW
MPPASNPSRNGAPPIERMRVALELEIPSDVRYIERIVELITRQCAELDFPARHCALNVPVALSEALSNAILRGNREDPSRHVRVRAAVDAKSLVLEVADEGEGFDIDACMIDPTAPENLAREDGRGLFLMRRLMHRVERFTDGGNVVRLTLLRE